MITPTILPAILQQLEKNKRYKSLFLLLLRAEDFVSSAILARELKVTSRTIKKDIQFFKESLAIYQIMVYSKSAYGYRLKINNEELEIALKTHFQISQPLTINNKFQARAHFILRMLLSTAERIKVEQLQRALFLGSSLSKELTAVKEWLEAYGLQLNSKPYHGLAIEGEWYKKIMLTVRMYKYFSSNNIRSSGVKTFDNLFLCPEIKRIRHIFTQTIMRSTIVFSDIYAERFIIYLIYCRYINKKYPAFKLDLPQLNFTEQNTREAHFVANLLVNLQQQLSGFLFSLEMQRFLTYVAIASSDLYRFSDCNEDNYQQLLLQSNELQQFVIQTLSNFLQVDLHTDNTCCKDLLKMLLPISMKIKIGVSDDVDLGFYDFSVINDNIILHCAINHLYQNLAQKYHYYLSRREYYFIFDILNGMFNRIVIHNKKLKLAIIAINGRLSTQQLKFNLRRHFADLIEKIETKVLYQLEFMPERDYDYYLCHHYGKNMNIPYRPIYFADENMTETEYVSSLNDIFYSAYPYQRILPAIEYFVIHSEYKFNVFPIQNFLPQENDFSHYIIDNNNDKIAIYFCLSSPQEYCHIYHFQHSEDMTLHGIKQFIIISLCIAQEGQKLKMAMNFLNQIALRGNIFDLCQVKEKSYQRFFIQHK